MLHLNETSAADFTHRATNLRSYAPRPIITGVLLFGLLAGPGNTLAFPVTGSWAHEPTAHAPAQVDASAMVAPAAELITQIKEGWQFNMTELADLMGVQRPTLYNWQNGKTSPDSKLQKQLQTLAAAAEDWKKATAGSNWDFLLDYSGPKADEVTIRETLGRADVKAREIRDMIQLRLKQYQEAYARSREILGEPLPLPETAPPESARRMNALWAKNAKKLHAARNRNS